MSVGRSILHLKKSSPTLFFVGGTVGVVGAAVMACRATLKLDETVEGVKQDLMGVKQAHVALAEARETNNLPANVEEADKALNKDLAFVYLRGAGSIAKLYGPAVVVGSISIGALTGSHVALSRRNTALTAAYGVLAKGLAEYRDRVADKIGDEQEVQVYRNVHIEEREDEDGKVIKATVADAEAGDLYRVLFDEHNRRFKKSAELNRNFIQIQQNYANHLLSARGHVFLNEVLDNLGFEPTPAGQVVGWLLGGEGDDHIDFGLFEEESEEFMFGNEPRIWLDFNVDGVIYDKI
jgi:hypothetical protein